MPSGRSAALGFTLFAAAIAALLREEDRCGAPYILPGGPPSAQGPATAGIGSYGDTILWVGNGRQGSVGFKYRSIAVLCFDLWTWGGTYCVYEPAVTGNGLRQQYRPISRGEAAELLGKSQGDLVPPFWYRFPPGLFFVGLLLIVGLCRGVMAPAGKAARSGPRWQICPACGLCQTTSADRCICGRKFAGGDVVAPDTPSEGGNAPREAAPREELPQAKADPTAIRPSP